MKKFIFCCLTVSILAACNNSTTEAGNEPGPVPVENVNGNVPDSNNSLNQPGPARVDSSRLRDSTSK